MEKYGLGYPFYVLFSPYRGIRLRTRRSTDIPLFLLFFFYETYSQSSWQ